MMRAPVSLSRVCDRGRKKTSRSEPLASCRSLIVYPPQPYIKSLSTHVPPESKSSNKRSGVGPKDGSNSTTTYVILPSETRKADPKLCVNSCEKIRFFSSASCTFSKGRGGSSDVE